MHYEMDERQLMYQKVQNDSVDFSISYYIGYARLYDSWIPLWKKIKTDDSLRSRNYINM